MTAQTYERRPDTTSGLTVEAFSAGYGALTVCRDISLRVAAGNVVALLGPNGAGKTTFVKGLAGLIRSTGKVSVDGVELSRSTAHHRARAGLVTVPDDRGLFPDLTVAENLRLGAALGTAPDGAERVVRSTGVFEVLLRRWHQPAGLLSGGEQQMLAIAKALAAEPKVILMDEPSQGLSTTALRDIEETLTSALDEDLAVLITEQNIDLVRQIATHFLVLIGGRAVHGGDIAELDPDDIAKRFLS